MQRKLLFFVNPRAGHSEIRGSLMQVIQIFTAGGYEVTVHPTSAPRDLTRQIEKRAADFDLVVCTGGDGTLNEAVSGLMQLPLTERPPLGYIPGGTVNDVARTLGLSMDPILAAQDIVTGREFPIDVGAFGENRWFVYVAAFGLFTGVSYQTPQEDKQILGRLAYFLHGVKALGEVKPIHARVEFDGQSLELDVLDGLVCSTTSVGGVLALDSLGISLNDGQSELLLVRDIKNLIDFNNVSTALLKSDFRENENIVSKKVRRVKFLFDSPVDWTLDGEYGGTVKEVEIVNHQRAINIIVPR